MGDCPPQRILHNWQRCPRCRTEGKVRPVSAHMFVTDEGEEVDGADYECTYCGHQWRQPLWRIP